MSDNKDRILGQWFNPLLKSEERASLKDELKDSEVEEHAQIWETAGNFNPPEGRSLEVRLTQLENALDEEVKVVPMYRSRSFRNAVGAFVAASVLFSLLYVLRPSTTDFDQQFIAEVGERKEISLPDGSIVQLNASSEIQFSREEWVNHRIIELSGEAFFDVQPSDIPFIVKSGSTNVTVLGTSFNIKNRNKVTHISCLTGKVGVDNNGRGEVILTKGLGTRVSLEDKPIPPFTIDVNQINSWVEGKFYFTDTPLDEVLEEMERQFDIAITTDLDFTSRNFNGYFMDQDLEKSLSIVCLSAGLKFEISGNNVKIYN